MNRPPPGTPAADPALTSLIGRPYAEAAAAAGEAGYRPIHAAKSRTGGAPESRRFFRLNDVRLVSAAGRVTAALVPRPLVEVERRWAADTARLLFLRSNTTLARQGTAAYDSGVSVLSDLFLLSFPVYDPTRAAVTTFLVDQFRRYFRPALMEARWRDLARLPDTLPHPPDPPEWTDPADLLSALWPAVGPTDRLLLELTVLADGRPTLSEVGARVGWGRSYVKQRLRRLLAAARREPVREFLS